MVATATAYDFSAVIDGFFVTRKLRGAHHALITASIRERALQLLGHADVRYMPAFKILDMLAAMVDMGVAIAEAAQLRPTEIRLLLRESLSNTAPLVRQFILEAALERARYEPLMLSHAPRDDAGKREVILQRRWAAMRAAHQENAPLPEAWMDVVDHAVAHAMEAKDFRHFRAGPLLQFFAEMLSTARTLHQQKSSLSQLADSLRENGALWRRYALKSNRFGEKPPVPVELNHLQPPHTIH